MISVKNTRRLRSSIELICAKLGIDDKELNEYIKKGTVKKPAAPKKATVKK
jgi:hypothetical protein